MSSNGVGYKKPPKEHQFRKGQSGCPDGGWAQRRANAKAKAKKQKALEQELSARMRASATRLRTVTIDGKKARMMEGELNFEQLQLAARDKENVQSQRLYFSRVDKLGLMDAPAAEKFTGVVVVERPLPQDQWMALAEATTVPLDPLEGLPGIDRENLITAKDRRHRRIFPEDEE